MFAVFKTGGKQYKVSENDLVEVASLEAKPGEAMTFGEVLMVGGEGAPKFGAPLVKGAEIAAEIVEQRRADKIIVFKKRRRHNYRRKKGHRQDLTVVRITGIKAG